MANEYVTVTELKATLSVDGTTYLDADLAQAAEAASRMVDRLAGRRFYQATETRFYTVTPYTNRVAVDDVTGTPTVTADLDGDGIPETVWADGTDYVLAPVNAGVAGMPYTELILTSPITPWTWSDSWSPERPWPTPLTSDRFIQIEGTFGWLAPPPEVKTATVLLANRLLKRMREAPLGVVAAFEGAFARVAGSDPDVDNLLAPYRLTVVHVG